MRPTPNRKNRHLNRNNTTNRPTLSQKLSHTAIEPISNQTQQSSLYTQTQTLKPALTPLITHNRMNLSTHRIQKSITKLKNQHRARKTRNILSKLLPRRIRITTLTPGAEMTLPNPTHTLTRSSHTLQHHNSVIRATTPNINPKPNSLTLHQTNLKNIRLFNLRKLLGHLFN